MKMIFHHLRKDIHAQRWVLLLFGLVLVLEMGIDALEIQPDYHLARTAEFVRSTMVLSLTGAILWIVLLVRLIQSEPVSGTGSFWLTRPVPRSVYIPSKLIFIAFLLILPYAVPTPLDMLHFQADSGMTWGCLKSSLVLQILQAVLVLWLATYTRSMSQFWILAVSVALAAFALFAGAIYFHSYLLPSRQGTELWMSRCIVFGVTFFAGLFISLLIEHTRRKTRAGFRLGVACVLAAVLAVFFWPFALSFKATPALLRLTTFFFPSFFDSTTTKSITVEYLPDWRDHLSWQFDSQANVWAAAVPLTPAAASVVPVPILQSVNASFQIEGERPQTFPNQISALLNEAGQFDFTPTIKADLPDIQISNRPDENLHAPMRLFTLRSETAGQLRNKTGTLTVNLFGRMQSLVRKAAIPLGDRALGRLPGEIIHVAWLPQAPQTHLNIGDPGDKPVLDVWSLSYEKRPSITAPVRYYLLVDPQSHTGTFLYDAQANRYATTNPFSSKSSHHTFLRLEGNEPLSRMVLYIYQLVPGDYFNASLRAPDFTMNPPL